MLLLKLPIALHILFFLHFLFEILFFGLVILRNTIFIQEIQNVIEYHSVDMKTGKKIRETNMKNKRLVGTQLGMSRHTVGPTTMRTCLSL